MNPSQTPSSVARQDDFPRGRRRWYFDHLASSAVAAACLLMMILTEPFLAIVWDEGYTLGRDERVRSWLVALHDPKAFAARWQAPIEELVPPNRIPAPPRNALGTRAGLLSPPVLAWFWPFAREEPDGHPPFYTLVALLGDFLAPSWEALPRARLGTMLVYSLTCGAIFSFFQALGSLVRRRGRRHVGLPAAPVRPGPLCNL